MERPHPTENNILHTETAVNAYNVYGNGVAPQRLDSAQQRHASTNIKTQSSQSRIINVAAGDGNNHPGYLNTQPNHRGDFDTESSNIISNANNNNHQQQEEEEKMIRRH